MVSHQGQFPAVTLRSTCPRRRVGQAVDKIHALERELRMPPTVNGSFQGTAQAFRSLESTPLLVAAAILVVDIVLGVLTRATSTRSGSCRRCRRRRRRAAGTDVFGYDLSVIAHDRHDPADRHRQEERDHDDRLRLQAERYRARPARGNPRGLPVAVPPDHDDDLPALFGAMPIAFGGGAGPSCGVRSASRWSADPGIATADAVHDAGHLPLSRPLARFLGASTRRRAWRRRSVPGREPGGDEPRGGGRVKPVNRAGGQGRSKELRPGRPEDAACGNGAFCRDCSPRVAARRSDSRSNRSGRFGQGFARLRAPVFRSRAAGPRCRRGSRDAGDRRGLWRLR